MKSTNLMLPLFALLERAGTVSIPQAATLLGATEDQVYDALEELLFAYDTAAGIRLELGERGCAFARLESGGQQMMRLTCAETDILLDALRSCGIETDSPLAAKLVATKGTAREDGSRPELSTAEPGEDSEIMHAVALACDEDSGWDMIIEYQGEKDAEPRERAVKPQRIISQNGHRYLRAWCLDALDVRDFRIDRICSAYAAIIEWTMEDFQKMERKSGSAAKAQVSFAAGAPLPTWPGASVRRQADGSALVEVEWLGSRWLPKQIAAQLGAAQVVFPKELDDAVRAYAAELLADIPA